MFENKTFLTTIPVRALERMERAGYPSVFSLVPGIKDSDLRPSYGEAFSWFMNRFDICPSIFCQDNRWKFSIYKIETAAHLYTTTRSYRTWNEAATECIIFMTGREIKELLLL